MKVSSLQTQLDSEQGTSTQLQARISELVEERENIVHNNSQLQIKIKVCRDLFASAACSQVSFDSGYVTTDTCPVSAGSCPVKTVVLSHLTAVWSQLSVVTRQLTVVLSLLQRIIVHTGTETRQLFSRVFVMLNFFK